MPTHRSVVDALIYSAQLGDPVVLATVVRVTGSSYGGVGARMVVHADGSTVGLVSGGCLESDIAEHARRVHASERAEVVSYDTRNDDDAPWGLGLGCNGLIEVLLEPLSAADANSLASIIGHALDADLPTVLATVIVSTADTGAPAIGAHTLITGSTSQTTGDWGDGVVLANAASATDEALAAGRRGLVREYGTVEVAFEVVAPSIRLLICGSGPDALPLATFASQLGWEVVVVDHREVDATRPARFPGARVVECTDALKLADTVALTGRIAAVVVSHHFSRDLDYVQALLTAGVAYVGVLGPRARTQRMLAELVARGLHPVAADGSLFAPVGLDIGGDGPEAIALAIIAEVQAVANDRAGGHLRDRRGSLHPAPSMEPQGAT
ncbi:MAG: XdhC family protein [Gemmatimonadaceae bacterium]